MPRIAVVIPTRDRGAQAAEAAAAVLNDSANFELLVVDQSTDNATEEALKGLGPDPRLRWVRSSERGVSNARNLGVGKTSAPIIAFTDDDCRPDPGWVSALLRVFDEHPDADFVFGRVRVPSMANENDYAAAFEPKRRIQRGVPLPDGDLGISANLAVRRQALRNLGGFDPLLGAGAPYFRGGEETDLLIRALHHEYRVVNAKECNVLHIGIRTGGSARPLLVAYQVAVGAAFGKHARLNGPKGLRDVARWVAFFTRKTVSEVVHLRRPRPGVIVYFIACAALSMRYRVDRKQGVFREWDWRFVPSLRKR
jgi:glycosyltransferase involved in cell wall biosynthesis